VLLLLLNCAVPRISSATTMRDTLLTLSLSLSLLLEILFTGWFGGTVVRESGRTYDQQVASSTPGHALSGYYLDR